MNAIFVTVALFGHYGEEVQKNVYVGTSRAKAVKVAKNWVQEHSIAWIETWIDGEHIHHLDEDLS